MDVEVVRPIGARFGEGGPMDRLTQYAAGTCYQYTKEAAVATNVPVKALWKSKHLTTVMHDAHDITFRISGIPVSLVTFGLHLVHPFYNSSQTSGRYCVEMFNQQYSSVREFIEKYYPNTSTTDIDAIDSWVKDGIGFFNDNTEAYTAMAKDALRRERPNFEGDVDKHALRLGQEQLRGFISTIVPTNLLYTVNIPAIAAMSKAAWNPVLKDVCDKMYRLVMSDEPYPQYESWVPNFNVLDNSEIVSGVGLTEPNVLAKSLPSLHKSMTLQRHLAELVEMYQNNEGLNILPFSPKANTIGKVPKCCSIVEVSVATLGQEQRHRTIRRGMPEVTSNFYLPPLVRSHQLSVDFAIKHYVRYNKMVQKLSPELMLHFIPYGAMVKYYRECELEAWIHSAKKRCCWNAMAEIASMEKQHMNIFIKNKTLHFGPSCRSGQCSEGTRYCGRELKNTNNRILI